MTYQETKKSFVFYESYLNSINEIKDNETKLEVFLLISNYGINGTILENVSDISKSIFQAHRINIDYSKARRKINISNGLKGGAPKGNSNAKKRTKQPKTTKNNQKQPNNNLNVNVNVNGNDNGNIYRPPKYEELLNYAKENNIPKKIIDSFFNHYESCKWLDKNKNPIDWENKLEWWFSQSKEKEPLQMPKYDMSKNKEMSEKEKDELLKLMKKEKENINYESKRY